MKFIANQYPKGQIKREQGMALITVLLVIALCFILVTEILTKQGLQTKRIQNIIERQQAFWYAQGAEQFVRSLLEKIIKDDNGVINLSQAWAEQEMQFPVDNGLIKGEIIDLHSCLNLNGLYNKNMSDAEKKARKDIFVRYFESLDEELDVNASELVNNIIDWLDEDNYPIDGLGYDGDMYTTLDFPYLTANSLFANENELRLIYEVTPLLMEEVKEDLCVLPNSEVLEINVNTVTDEQPELLMALLDIDKGAAESIIKARPDDGFKTIDEFWQLREMQFAEQKPQLDKSLFTVQSKFFKLITNAHYNDAEFPLTTIMQQKKDKKVQIIARRFGGVIERKANTETE